MLPQGAAAGKSLWQQVAALPACNVHRGLGSGVRQPRTHQPLVPCSPRISHDDWWEEWRPSLDCSVFPGPACQRWFLAVRPFPSASSLATRWGRCILRMVGGTFGAPWQPRLVGSRAGNLWCWAGLPVGCCSPAGLMFLSLMRCSPLLLL